jgi:hypothetical protein
MMSREVSRLDVEPAAARARIAVAFGIALLVSGLAIVVAVLPAEFGVDPTGLGRRLGLLALSDVKTQLAAFEASRAAGAVAGQTVVAQDGAFQQETISFTLAPGEFVEYKYRLEKGESLLYAWQATTAVNLEFHAEPDGAPEGYAETYDKRSGVERASGTLVAPFAGIHGWYWENPSAAPATVTLSAAGFFNMSHEFHKDAPPKTRMFQ